MSLDHNQLTGEIPPAVCDLIESNNLDMDDILNGNNLINTCDSQHTNAEGYILKDEDGNEIYREFQGVLTGSIDLSVGNILKLTVHFINYNGEEINHEEDELRISENDTAIVIIEVEEGEEEHVMAIHITGVNEGLTSFKLELMHGDHSDYTSISNIPVTVNP